MRRLVALRQEHFDAEINLHFLLGAGQEALVGVGDEEPDEDIMRRIREGGRSKVSSLCADQSRILVNWTKSIFVILV